MDQVSEFDINPSGHGNSEDAHKFRLLNVSRRKMMDFRLDFEVGYLIKSPCRECRGDTNLPGCAAGCVVLQEIQTILAESISCTRRF